jgi:pantothenate kinase
MLDPTPFAAFGVLGGLLFALVILALLVRNMIDSQNKRYESQSQTMIDFIKEHQNENTKALNGIADKNSAALSNVADKVFAGHDKLAQIIERHTRKLDEFLLTREVLSRMEAAKRRGDSLDDTVVEKIVRTVQGERSHKDG